MTKKTYNNGLTLEGALHIALEDELYERQVVRIWNEYCQDQNMNEDEVYAFCGDCLDEVFSGWAPSEIAFAIRRTDERDEWFKISTSCSEINCFPNWELFNYVDSSALVEWLIKNNRWKEYEELNIEEDEEEE